VRGETVAVDGSKFRAVSSAKAIRERDAMKRYLEQLDAADEQDEVVIDASAVQAALAKLRRDPEPHLMRMGNGFAPLTSKESSGAPLPKNAPKPQSVVRAAPEPRAASPQVCPPASVYPCHSGPIKPDPPSMEMFAGRA
jgi:hypothetical protein